MDHRFFQPGPWVGMFAALSVAALLASCGGAEVSSQDNPQGAAGSGSASGDGGRQGTEIAVVAGSAGVGTVGDLRGELKSVSFGEDGLKLAADGSTPLTHQLKVSGTYASGAKAVVTDVEYTVDDPSVLNVDGNGLVTATGRVGGKATITVKVGKVTAQLVVDVTLTRVLDNPEVTASAIAAFDTATTDADEEASLVYPLEGAVMPQNVYPADLQWLRGVEGDVFQVSLSKPHVSITAYVVAGTDFENAGATSGEGSRRQLPELDAGF